MRSSGGVNGSFGRRSRPIEPTRDDVRELIGDLIVATQSTGDGDLVGAVLVEFHHRTRAPWLDREYDWLVKDVEWLESELDHVLGIAVKPPPPCPACAEPEIGGERMFVCGCPDCARRERELNGYARWPQERGLDWAGVPDLPSPFDTEDTPE